ncbi:PREDICTED: two-component response regulator ARR1 [Populus euphratica]|uniref:Two-component response regulator ARR1 n=1 Tax=Populus euphratica TaxID=75702 RepID=A0AAJ6V5G5_POPEU|nr:PREDICTED: two-component response regulator ARR1 [Populus euphratica]
MASSQSSSIIQNSPLLKIKILVVDDDSTSLSIVSAMLKTCSYKENRKLELTVVSVKNPFDALSTLRLKKGVFDLVVTDLHMPEMNGMELQHQVDEEFKLPVIIMSSDDSEKVILRALEGGAAFYIVKPINKDDLKNVWQYAVATKRGKCSLSIKEIGGSQESSSSTLFDQKISVDEVNSAKSTNNKICNEKDRKNKNRKRTKEDQEVDSQLAPKRPKVLWTSSLHSRFLQAINHIGLDKAVPKRILEFMSVPGLSRENVASHLQKYRIFLKKVAERGTSSSKNLSGRVLKSNFASSQPSLMLKNFQQEYSQFSRQRQVLRASVQAGFGGNTIPTPDGGSNFGSLHSPKKQAPNNSALQSPYKQSRSCGNPTGFQQLTFGNANQANKKRSGLESNNNTGTIPPSRESVPIGLTRGKSPTQRYQPQNQGRSNLQSFDSSEHNKFGSIGVQATNYRSRVGNVGNNNNSSNTNSNYAGIRVNTDGQLIGAGQMQVSKDELSNGFGNCGLMNWTHNGNMNAASSSYLAQRGSFPASIESANQFSPTLFTSAYQGNAPMLPPRPRPPPQQLGLGNGGQNDFAFGLMNNSPPIFGGNYNQQQQYGQGELNFSDMLLEPTSNFTAYQPQGVDQVSTPLHDLLHPDFLNSLHIDDNTPWNEQPSSQVQSGEEAMNPFFGGNTSSMDGYFPNFNQASVRHTDIPALILSIVFTISNN